jgi:hypothetical protein
MGAVKNSLAFLHPASRDRRLLLNREILEVEDLRLRIRPIGHGRIVRKPGHLSAKLFLIARYAGSSERDSLERMPNFLTRYRIDR